MKLVKKTLAFLLVFCMCFSVAPTAFAEGPEEQTKIETQTEEQTDTDVPAADETTETEEVEKSDETTEESEPASLSLDTVVKERSVPLNTDEMYKIYHLDCGRKYFSVEQIKEVIDTIAESDYNTLELALGNDGLRFLLDDMEVSANGTTYSSEDVKAGVQEGNRNYCNAGTNELTEKEMDEIFAYAQSKDIAIIPLINSPGHMDAILTAASKVTDTDCSYNGSVRTIDVTKPEAVNFTMALLDKYIQYFAGKGCTIFNIGCDEYANDIYTDGSMGFGQLVAEGNYGAFVNYVNNLAAQVQNAGMTAMAFNDGFYFNGNTLSGTFDTDIAIAFWSSGWGSYKSMSAADLAARGHAIINTNGDWYYILGMSDINSVTANIQKTPYDSVMGSGAMDVEGSMLCYWCDKPALEYTEAEASNLITQVSTFAEANPSVFEADPAPEPSPEPTPGGEENVPENTETITISVGGTKTTTIHGVNYAGEYETADPSVATVTVTGKDAVEATETYTPANNVTCNTLINSDSSSWRAVSGYYCQAPDGNYYPLYAKRASKGALWWRTYTYTWGYSATGSSNNVTPIGEPQETDSTGARPNITVYTRTQTPATEASTTITFKAGNTPGTSTYVDIGDTRYIINVVQDFSGVEDLTLEYWITNGRPTDDGGSTVYDVGAEEAYSEEGVDVTSLSPENTYREGRMLLYWRSRLLDTTKRNDSESGREEQTETSGDDETYSGVEFTKVRYWNDAWAVYTEDNEWVTVENKHQLVSYYLEILPISRELGVTAADWGKKADGSVSGDYMEAENSVTVSVQVVYEDGSTNPVDTTAEALMSCTMAYNYWQGGRGIGTLNLNGQEGYQIWKVEAETGSERYRTDGDQTYGSFTVTHFEWDNNPVTVYEGDPVDSYVLHNNARNPERTGYYRNLMWDENNEAILIKVYVKQKPTEDNLKVIYYDERFDDELYSYDINVTDGVDFTDITPTPPAFEGNPERIDVTGCGIENIFEVDQKFQTDLTQVPEAVGRYNSDLYEYTGSVISEDNRTLYLYYNINTEVLSPLFVADYGRPITFGLDQVVNEPETVAEVSVRENTRYGTLAYDAGSKQFTYTPDEVLPNIDVLTINIRFDGSSSASTTNAGVMPATTVNYEEGFAKLNGFSGGSTGSTAQTAQIAGESTDEYGYDAGVSGETNNAAVAQAKGSTAEFSFTGTGVDLYVNSTASSGNIAVQVRDASDKLVKVMSIDTTSNSTITENFSDTDQKSLVGASVQGLAHGEYTVKVTTISDDPVYFDGFRVYGTIDDQKNEYYVADKEDEPVFLELRDYVLTAMNVDAEAEAADVYAQVREATDGQLTGVVLGQAGETAYDGQELLDNGPKNELFLLPGQSVVFKVNTDREVQVGLKAVNGSANVTGSYNGTITTDKDMFYTVANAAETSSEKTITINNTAASDTILSVTQVKICDDPKAVFAELTEDDFSAALSAMKGTGTPDAPEVTTADATANIILTDATGSELASTALTANGAAGETHTFAAADIRAAAEGILPEGYELTGEASDVKVAYGESETVELQAEETAAEEPDNSETEDEGGFFDKIGNAIKDVVDTAVDAVTGFFGSLFGW